MALTISHEETERLAQALARETGEPVTQVILEALQQRACQLREQRAKALALARIQAAAQRCRALPDRDALVMHSDGERPHDRVHPSPP